MKNTQSTIYTSLVILALVIFVSPMWAVQETSESKNDLSKMGSLVRVPQSTGIYYATMNHEQIFDSIFNSNAWEAIKKSEVSKGMKKAYRRGRTRGYQDYNEDNPFAQFLEFYGSTFDGLAANTIKEVGLQVVGNEIFFYLDNDAVTLVEASQNAQAEILDKLGVADFEELTPEDTQRLVELLVPHFEDVDCPTMIMGARLEDPDGFRGLLQMTQAGMEQLFDGMPADLGFARDFWKVIENKKNYLMLAEIDMSELPWDELGEQIDDEDSLKKIKKLLNEKQVTMAFGIVDNLLIVGVGKDKNKFVKFGDGDQLVDLPELSKLHEAMQRNETIASVFYKSAEFAKMSDGFSQISDSQKAVIRPLVLAMEDMSSEEQEALIEQLEKDVDELAADIQGLQQSSAMNFSFTSLCEDGLKGYCKTEMIHPAVNGSKPLELGSHAGPSTVGFIIQRPANVESQFNFLCKWSSKVYRYIKPEFMEQLAESLEGVEDAGEGDVEAIVQGLEEMLASFADTTRESFLPAVKNQEVGVFIEMISQKTPWHSALEQSESAAQVPIPMPALVVGTSDAKKINDALKGYAEAFKKMANTTGKHSPSSNAESVFDIDSAFTAKQTESGMSYRADITNGEIPGIQLGTLVSKDWVVMNLNKKQAADLAKAGRADLFGPVKTDKPSVSLMFYDNRAMMNSMRPWLDFAQSKMRDEGVEFDMLGYTAERDTLQFTEAQLQDVFERCWDMAGCWKGYSSRSYEESGATVTEFLFKFQDLPPVKD